MGQVIQGNSVSLNSDRGAIVKQVSSPGTPQTGANINVDGNIVCAGQVQPGSVLASGSISSLTSLSAPSISRNNLELGAIGTSFPVGPSNGQRYFHTTYMSSFVYNATDTKWRQEAPGVFSGSFPTVSSGDNTVAPKIQITRLDRGITYYWDGTQWLSNKIWLAGISRATQPVPQATTFLDCDLMDDFDSSGGLYVTALAMGLQFNTAQSTTNFYTISLLYTTDGTNYTIVNPTANADTKALTSASVAYRIKPTLTAFVLPNNARNLAVRLVPTAAPGTFFLSSSLTCQLVG